MANFKEIMAMCLNGASYSAMATALGCSNRDIAKAITHAKFRYRDATLTELINVEERGINLRQHLSYANNPTD